MCQRTCSDVRAGSPRHIYMKKIISVNNFSIPLDIMYEILVLKRRCANIKEDSYFKKLLHAIRRGFLAESFDDTLLPAFPFTALLPGLLFKSVSSSLSSESACMYVLCMYIICMYVCMYEFSTNESL